MQEYSATENLYALQARLKTTAKGGVEWRFDCPFCAGRVGRTDQKGHLYFNNQSQLWMCHRCKAKGRGAHTLLAGFGVIVHGSREPVALSGPIQTTPEPAPLPDLILLPDQAKAIEPGSPAWNYLTWPRDTIVGNMSCRELDPVWVRAFGLLDWEEKCRIVIPVFASGELTYWVARTYIGNEPKYLNVSTPRRKVVFNYDQSKLSNRIYICEGPFSAMAFGPEHAVALLGKMPTRDQIDLLCRHPAKQLVVAFDGDAQADTDELSERLYKWVGGRKEVLYLEFPKDRDPGDYDQESLLAWETKKYDPLLTKMARI
jgi:hypothetical protein